MSLRRHQATFTIDRDDVDFADPRIFGRFGDALTAAITTSRREGKAYDITEYSRERGERVVFTVPANA